MSNDNNPQNSAPAPSRLLSQEIGEEIARWKNQLGLLNGDKEFYQFKLESVKRLLVIVEELQREKDHADSVANLVCKINNHQGDDLVKFVELQRENDSMRGILERLKTHCRQERYSGGAMGGSPPKFIGCHLYRSDDAEEYCLPCEAEELLKSSSRELATNQTTSNASDTKETTFGCGHTNQGSCSQCLGRVTNERNDLLIKNEELRASIAIYEKALKLK